ncbi:DUF2934 domain-containing protein [Belnapia moabensis]|uniref:DUF2934 domain-containing protein n=1 Tax=Belnapia moabensis TaxID=365533 RepID=UPI000A01F659|nr:DUF2934 domain-containing protein [Belnapia moabensis]
MPVSEHPEVQSVRERAYFLWQEDGCPDGRAEYHWFRAMELERMAQTVAPGATSGTIVVDSPRQAISPRALAAAPEVSIVSSVTAKGKPKAAKVSKAPRRSGAVAQERPLGT